MAIVTNYYGDTFILSFCVHNVVVKVVAAHVQHISLQHSEDPDVKGNHCTATLV